MHVKDANEYEDLLAEWSDLESGLGIILSHPESSQEFARRVQQYDRWMQSLLQRDADAGLYLLFQLASNSPVGYSASHALICAVLCHLTAAMLDLPPKERDSLVRAALTMNVAMTAMQDVLANQTERPSQVQQDMIRLHPVKGAMLLGNLGVQDEDWLEIVGSHHDPRIDEGDFASVAPAVRLCRILKMVDRYAAMISPRLSRAGRTATESARTVLANSSAKTDAIGHALMCVVGLCPPGTFVRMDSDELGVVLRRSLKANLPYVAIVGSAEGQLLPAPRLHATAQGAPSISVALPASGVRAQLNHYQILRLGSFAAELFA
ncbi:MAG: phosphodiesterase [Rhodoferax sp.]|nr:phosphodiesterase [Rhodoferax sp.]